MTWRELLGLCGLAAFSVAYVASNIGLALVLRLTWRGTARARARLPVVCAWVWVRFVLPAHRSFVDQLYALPRSKVHAAVGLQLLALAGFAFSIWHPLNWLVLVSLVLGFCLFYVALAVSILSLMPVVRRWWDDPGRRVLSWGVPLFALFVAKATGGARVQELFDTGASNLPYTWVAATISLLCLVSSVGLTVVSVILDLALFAFWLGERKQLQRSDLHALFAVSVVTTLTAGFSLIQLPAQRFGDVMLHAVAFEFDAAPARYCELSAEEALKGTHGLLKVLPLSTAQDKALLIERSPALLDDVVLRQLGRTDTATREVKVLRPVECYKPKVACDGSAASAPPSCPFVSAFAGSAPAR